MEISSGRYEAQARLEAILKAAVDAIVVIDERGRIELFSTAAERLFGWRAADVIGKNVSMLMPEPYHGEHDSYLANYLESGSPKIIGIGREVQATDRQGEVFPVELSKRAGEEAQEEAQPCAFDAHADGSWVPSRCSASASVCWRRSVSCRTARRPCSVMP